MLSDWFISLARVIDDISFRNIHICVQTPWAAYEICWRDKYLENRNCREHNILSVNRLEIFFFSFWIK